MSLTTEKQEVTFCNVCCANDRKVHCATYCPFTKQKRGQHLGGESEIYVQHFTALRNQSFNLTSDEKYENRKPNYDAQQMIHSNDFVQKLAALVT
jgi:hypothetical protein